MKRFALGITVFLMTAIAAFAANDLTPLVIVKLNKTETITLKQLKNRVEMYQKQNNIASFTVDQKKEILQTMIDEKLVLQAAAKAGFSLTDTQVNQYFLSSFSQRIGHQVTEAELAEIVKTETGHTLDEELQNQVGMNVKEYKAHLKNQLTAQQYVIQLKRSEIQSAAPTDEEIRAFYEINKASFVQNDMVKLFLVIVPKGKDVEGARVKANKLLNDVKDKKRSDTQIKADMAKDSSYQSGDLLIAKTAQHAQQLNISYQELIDLFAKNIGYISTLNETNSDFQFYVVRAKYAAKMLGLSDIVQPETTVTVYDYIKQNLTQQKQSQYLLKAIEDVTAELDTPANVDRKKTGEDLNKLLNW